MMAQLAPRPVFRPVSVLVSSLLFMAACGEPDVSDLGTRYAEAWSSQDPDRLASFYAEDGSLIVNAGEASIGRPAIRDAAAGFMEAFPDMRVTMDSIVGDESRATFHWRWTGTNTGPGGTGRPVDLHGYEEWTLHSDGLIAESKGHYDEAEYRRQVLLVKVDEAGR